MDFSDMAMTAGGFLMGMGGIGSIFSTINLYKSNIPNIVVEKCRAIHRGNGNEELSYSYELIFSFINNGLPLFDANIDMVFGEGVNTIRVPLFVDLRQNKEKVDRWDRGKRIRFGFCCTPDNDYYSPRIADKMNEIRDFNKSASLEIYSDGVEVQRIRISSGIFWGRAFKDFDTFVNWFDIGTVARLKQDCKDSRDIRMNRVISSM